MLKPKWSYCLSEEQFEKLYRIINKIAGFSDYLSKHDGLDLCNLVEDYTYLINVENTSTPGMRINLSVISQRYSLFRKEFEDRNKSSQTNLQFRLDCVLTWFPKPKWASDMSVAEIDYLDHFIPAIPGFSEFLYRNQDGINLYDLTAYYQLRLNALGKNNPDINFVLETIKERFYRIMDDHADAIHYVNHSHTIDDSFILEQFDFEAKNGFYTISLENNPCESFINKYIECSNPYISSELFLRLFRADKINIALTAAHHAFKYIFSSPNIYWHNKEAIFGSVNILYKIVEALGIKGLKDLSQKSPKLLKSLLSSLYLFLSRTIYWTDKESVKREKYDDSLLPINIQHKLRAYRLRAHLIESFGSLLAPDKNAKEFVVMALSDMLSAHELAYSNRIVGAKSVYKRDAASIFYDNGLVQEYSFEQAAENGFVLNDNLSQQVHSEYKMGTFCLNEKEISQLVSFLRLYFKTEKDRSSDSNPAHHLLIDNCRPKKKLDNKEIIDLLSENGVKYFYHFTEKDKINSIIKAGGLLSYKRCLDEGIVLPLREDMALSRDIDAQIGLEDFARLSISNHLPKISVRQNEGAELVMLKISTDVATFEETLFTDIEATHPQMRYGKTINDLKEINFDVAAKNYIPSNEREFLQQQAEILVRGIIPIKYILNIDNPETILKQ